MILDNGEAIEAFHGVLFLEQLQKASNLSLTKLMLKMDYALVALNQNGLAGQYLI